MRIHHGLGALLLVSLAVGSAPADAALEIPLTLAEPGDGGRPAAGIERIGEPVTSGVSLPPGTPTGDWALFDGDKEIPLQVTPLRGATPWILLDFQVDLPGFKSKTLKLRQARSTAAPAQPLEIVEDASRITVVTGPLKVQLSKSAFNLFDAVWLRGDPGRDFTSADQVVGSSGPNIAVLDGGSGRAFSGVSRPDKVVWEYKGPIRSTLRVEGRFRNGSEEFIAYTTRLSFFAGQSFVRVEHVLRNSAKANERYVKVLSATLRIGPGNVSVRAGGSGSVAWVNAGPGGVTFEAVPASYWKIDTEKNRGMLIPDLSYHGATLIAEFSKNLSAREQARRAKAAVNPLFALAPPGWYSEYGNLSTRRFGTLDDERATYKAWGWSWKSDQEPWDPHRPDYYVNWSAVDVHSDTEGDDLWQNLVMYLRTGGRGYLDRALAWARYFKWEYTYRTDGFDYAWDSDWEGGKNKVARPVVSPPLTALDREHLKNNVEDGRVDSQQWGADHMYGWGLVDYYYLTGDVDALQAATDLAEIADRMLAWRVPGKHAIAFYGPRQAGRLLILACRVFEATQEPRWKAVMEHIGRLVLESRDWHPRGLYVAPREIGPPGHHVTANGTSPHQAGELVNGLYLYYEITHSQAAKDRLIAMAKFAFANALDSKWQQSGRSVIVDYPKPGDVWLDGISGATSPPIISPLHTIAWIATLDYGYRLTGDAKFLERAKLHWDRGSKARYSEPANRRFAADNEVGKFVNNKFKCCDAGVYFEDNGHLPFVHMLFHDWIHRAPSPSSSAGRGDLARVAVAQTAAEPPAGTAGQAPSPDPRTVELLRGIPDNTWVAMTPKPRIAYESIVRLEPGPDLCDRPIESPDPVHRSYSGLAAGGGRIFYFGGGHSTHPGNDVDLYFLDANQWVVQHKPECPKSGSREATVITGSGSAWGGPTLQGRPYSQHAYQYSTYDSKRRRFLSVMASGTWAFDPATRSWELLAGPAKNTFSPLWHLGEGIVFYDREADRLVALALDPMGPTQRGVYAFDPESKQWQFVGGVPSREIGSNYIAGAYNPDRREFVATMLPSSGGSARLFRYAYGPNTWTEVPSFQSHVGGMLYNLAYDTTNRKMIFLRTPRRGRPGEPGWPAQIWSWDPEADVWSKLPVPPSAPPAIHEDVEWGAFAYEPTRNVFIYLQMVSNYCRDAGPGGACGGRTRTWAYRYARGRN